MNKGTKSWINGLSGACSCFVSLWVPGGHFVIAGLMDTARPSGRPREVAERSVGAYHYTKRLSDGRSIECRVEVFPLRVSVLLDDWPELRQRRRQWFTFPQAAMVVAEGELVTLLLSLAAFSRGYPQVAPWRSSPSASVYSNL